MIPEPHYSIYRDSDNFVARICLPQMRWEGRDETERKLFEQRYPREGEKMVGVVSRARDEGRDEGRHEGEAQLLLWLLEEKFDAAAAQRYREQVEQAEETALRRWSLRILKAETADEVFTEG